MTNPTLIYKYNLITLCTMFNTKPEHGDIYINCKNLIKLLDNFYIYATPPLSVIDFPREYFPFTLKSETPILFTTTYMFGMDDSLVTPNNKIVTELKIVCFIITLLFLYSKRSYVGLNSALNEFRNPIELLNHIYNYYYTSSKERLSDRIEDSVSYVDRGSLVSYVVDNVFRNHSTFDSVLESYKNTYGVDYDFFR